MWISKSNVVANRIVEQHRVLKHNTDVLPQIRKLQLANINSVKKYMPALRIVKPQQQPRDC